MKYETGTFELRGNDMMMRELTSAETDEVVGGTGFASVSAFTQSGAGSSVSASGSAFLFTSNTTASASISLTTTALSGANNQLGTSAFAQVF